MPLSRFAPFSLLSISRPLSKSGGSERKASVPRSHPEPSDDVGEGHLKAQYRLGLGRFCAFRYSGKNSLQRGIPALDADDKKFNSRLVAPTCARAVISGSSLIPSPAPSSPER